MTVQLFEVQFQLVG